MIRPGTATALLGLFLFAYILMRAFSLGFTFDEALTYNEFAQHDMGLFGPLTGDLGANHHPLNTFAMKFFKSLFGNEEWAVRIPNLICGATFFFFAALICRKIFSGWNVFFAFSILCLQHFILDYFSIARGYGMALGFGMTAVYFILDLLIWSKKKRSLFLFLVCVAAGVLSNLTFLYFLIAGWICMALWMPQKREVAKNILSIGIFVLFPVVAYYLLQGWIIDLKTSGTLYFGTKTDLYLNTLVSLGKVLVYDMPVVWIGLYILPPLGVLVFLAGLWHVLRRGLSKELFSTLAPHDVVWVMFAGTLIMTVAAVLFAGSLYPLDRTAFPILLLFLLQGITLLARFRDSLQKGLLVVFSGLSFTAFAFSVSADHVLLHKPDRDTEELLCFVNEHAKEHRDTSLFNSPVASDFVFLHTGNYYIGKDYLEELNPLERVPDYRTGEYVLIMKNSRHYADTIGLKALKRYPVSGSIVFQRDLKGKGMILLDSVYGFEDRGGGEDLKKNITAKHARSGKYAGSAHPAFQYSGFFEIILPDSLADHPLAISSKGWIHTSPGNRAMIVMEFLDSTGVVSWEGIYLQLYNRIPGEWNEFRCTRFAPLNYKKGTVCKVYVWNIGKDTTRVDDVQLRMVSFSRK